jgi:hypothetical protein
VQQQDGGRRTGLAELRDPHVEPPPSVVHVQHPLARVEPALAVGGPLGVADPLVEAVAPGTQGVPTLLSSHSIIALTTSSRLVSLKTSCRALG